MNTQLHPPLKALSCPTIKGYLMPDAGMGSQPSSIIQLLATYQPINKFRIPHEDLLTRAHRKLEEFGVPVHLARELAPHYARTVRMHLEQNGGILNSTTEAKLVSDVVKWHKGKKGHANTLVSGESSRSEHSQLESQAHTT